MSEFEKNLRDFIAQAIHSGELEAGSKINIEHNLTGGILVDILP